MYIIEEISDTTQDISFSSDPVYFLRTKTPPNHKDLYCYKIKSKDCSLNINYVRGDPKPVVKLMSNNCILLDSDILELVPPDMITMWYRTVIGNESWKTWFTRMFNRVFHFDM